MLHEVKFASSNGRDEVTGWIYVPACEPAGEGMYLNPGSVSIPKNGTPHSYMILEGEPFTWKTLEGEAFNQYRAGT